MVAGKRVITLSVIVMIALAMIAIFAEPVCAETEAHEVSTWAQLRELVNNSSEDPVSIKLTSDLTATSENVHNEGKTVEIDFDGFTIDGNGNQVFWNEKGEMTFKKGIIKNAKSDFGGAINNRGRMTIENFVIQDCSAIQGGAILNYGTLTMYKTSVKNCRAARGGGIRIVPHDSDTSAIARSATAVLTNCWITENTADGSNDTYGRGGGIGVSNGTLTMTDCEVTLNKSTDDDGGGIDFDASGKTLTLTNTIISGNSVTHSDRDGGGINLERGNAVISDCTIRGNSAPEGGGIYIYEAFGETVISGTTSITENNATEAGGGGINSHARLTLKDNIAITGNSAIDASHGVYHNGPAVNIQGKIVIQGNKDRNIFLDNSNKLNITGPITADSHIGVTLSSGCYVITSGFSASGSTEPGVFVPDDGKNIEVDEDGEVRISIGDPDAEETVIPGDLFNKVTVSFHPAGQQSSLSVRGNGGGAGQNVVQLYKLGDAFRFWLTKADSDSYYIDFFGGADDYSPSNKRLDLSDKGDDGYKTEGNVVHVVKGNEHDENKRWRFIRNKDGTYYIQNKVSGFYWDLENDNYDNKNKLCQRRKSVAQKWEMEIVHEDGNNTMNYLKRFDSYSFKRNGRSVTGANWMSFIPDDIVLSDVNIPGTHDAATAQCATASNYVAQCQQLSINDQLYAGLRYFDLRLDNQKRLVHGPMGILCKYKGDDLKLDTVMGWVKDFLKNNPKEAVVLQVKVDVDSFGKGEKVIYEYYKDMVKANPDLFYIGDHVPKMSECRGKIVILSRLDRSNSEFIYEGKKQWALDVHDWVAWTEHLSDPMELTCSGDNYEVWTQDFHKKVGDDKWTMITNSIFNKKTGAEAKHKAVKDKGKECWTVSYTSCVSSAAPVKWPQEAAREQNPRLVNMLLHDEDVLDGQFLGVVCSDFSDQQLAYLVYKQNFINDTEDVTIRGITKEGYEPVEPMTIEVSRYETLDNALDIPSVRTQIDDHFSSDYSFRPYGYYNRAAIDQLRRMPMSHYKNAEEYENDPAHLEDLHGYDKPTLYVALDQVINTMDRKYELDVETPVCGTTVTGADNWIKQTPKPAIDIRGGSVKLRVVEEDGIPKSNWYERYTEKLFNGTIEGGKIYCEAADFETTWGFCLSDKWHINFDVYADGAGQPYQKIQATTIDPKHLSTTMIEIEAMHDLKEVDEKAATCTEGGWLKHYYCQACGTRFDASDKAKEVSEEDVMIPAPGHDWIVDDDTDEDGWKVTKEATEEEAGEETRVCKNDPSHIETRVIPAFGHDHVLTKVKAKAATCEEEGSKGYYVCSGGDHPCGRYFTDEDGTTEIDKDDAVIPALGHMWSSVEYKWSDDKSKATARCVCARDSSHVQEEEAEVKAVIDRQPTCDEVGSGTLIAEFKNELFGTETQAYMPRALGHDWDEGTVTKEATCTVDGEITYKCSRDPSHVKTEAIKASGHDLDFRTAAYTATCTEGGVKVTETYCTVCGDVISSETENTDPTGHGWGPAEYIWSDDLTKVTAKHVCMNGCGTIEEETVNVGLVEVDPEPTCEEPGIKTWYSNEFENDEFIPQERTEEIPKTGHDWIVDADTDENGWKVTKEATETENGEETRICRNDESHVETRVIPSHDHEHALSHVEAKDATCEETGNIEYWVCDGAKNSCGRYYSAVDEETGKAVEEKEISREDTIIPALGHDWGEWKEEYPPTCILTGMEIRICKRDESHEETRLIDVDPEAHDWGDWTVTKKATEAEAGSESRVCKLEEDHTETREIPAMSLTAPTAKIGLIYIDEAQPLVTKGFVNGGTLEYALGTDSATAPGTGWGSSVPTGTAPGTYYIWYKVTGDDRYEDTEAKCITSNIAKALLTVTAKDQTIKEGENIETGISQADAKGLLAGHSLDKVTLTAGKGIDEGKILVSGAVIKDAEGQDVTDHYSIAYLPGVLTTSHVWGEPVYTWAVDNSEVTGKAVCSICGEVLEETVRTTSEVVKEPTCIEEGCTCYTAVFSNDIFETQSITTNDIHKAAHKFDEGKVTREATCIREGEYTYTCTVCGVAMTKPIDMIPHVITKVEAVPADCEHQGTKEHYECGKCGRLFSDEAGKTEIDVNSIVTPATGHRWGEPTYEWTEDNSEVTAARICGNDPSHKETETVKTEKVIVKEATEEAEGEARYTAEFKNTAFAAQVKTEVIPKIEPTPGPDPEDRKDQMGEDGTPFGKGAAIEAAEAAIADMTSDDDPAGTKIAPLVLRNTKRSKKTLRFTWKTAKGAAKYILYGNKCGKKNKLKKIAELGSSRRSYTATKIAGKKLKKATYYKFMIIAVDADNNVVSSSKIVHVATAGSRKKGNPKKVIVKAKVSRTGKALKKYRASSEIAVKAGKATKLKSTFTKARKTTVKKHLVIRYESSNKDIVKITKKGTVKGIRKGTAKNYAYAQNGAVKVVKVKVK